MHVICKSRCAFELFVGGRPGLGLDRAANEGSSPVRPNIPTFNSFKFLLIPLNSLNSFIRCSGLGGAVCLETVL